MQRSIPLLLAILAAACSSDAPSAAPAQVEARSSTVAPSASTEGAVDRSAAAPVPAPEPADNDLHAIPAAACAPEGYTAFVNAFAQFPPQRPRFVTGAGQAQLGEFDVALVDYHWQRPSDGVALEVDIARHGARVEMTATPVERDTNDEPVRSLGPPRRYVFEHRDGCWRYAGRS